MHIHRPLCHLALFSKAFVKPGRDSDCNSVSFLASREFLATDTSTGRRHVECKAPTRNSCLLPLLNSQTVIFFDATSDANEFITAVTRIFG